MRLKMFWPWRKRWYDCYHVVIHFPDAEQASEWINDMARRAADMDPTPRLPEVRVMKGGEKIPVCKMEKVW